MKVTSFEWDARKDRVNRLKHGVSFYEAQRAFFDKNRVITEDLQHSMDESRYYCLGKIRNKVMTVSFTYREDKIRIISAGFWRKGKQTYEEK